MRKSRFLFPNEYKRKTIQEQIISQSKEEVKPIQEPILDTLNELTSIIDSLIDLNLLSDEKSNL